MNSKAIRKQLLAAVAMVLVAAVALGSSTYAWFVASSSVTAKGMSVQAQAEGNLVIRYNLDTWGTVATADPDDMVNLLPASTDNLKNWVYSKASTSGSHVSDTKYTNLVKNSLVVPDTDNNGNANTSKYVMIRKFEVRSATKIASDADNGLFVKDITVTSGNSDPTKGLSTALRVGVRCGDTSLIFGPVNTPQYGPIEDTENPKRGVHIFEGESTSVTTKEVTLATLGSSGADSNNVLYSGQLPIDVDNGLPVYIYVWYEGEDTSLYSDNYAAEQLDVSVEIASITSINPDYVVPTPPSTNESGGTT